MRAIPVFLLTFCCVFINISPASAWGEKGHNATARVAQKHLTKCAERKITRLLDGHNMAYWSSWADGLRSYPEYDFIRTWHYANVEDGGDYASEPKLPTGDVYTAVEKCVEVLKSDNCDSVKSVYLKMLIHFVGDMHCPMHAGRASDRGGNGYTVTFRGRKTNLHSLWDSALLDGAHVWSAAEWAENIEPRMTRRQRKAMAAGTPMDWMEQTVDIADEIYDGTPQNEDLNWDYINKYSPLIEEQLLEGGLRLAKMLNELF